MTDNTDKVDHVRNVYDSQAFWIGLQDTSTTEDMFLWADGSNMTQLQTQQLFCQGEPNDPIHDERCGVVASGHDCLYDENCFSQHPYICDMTPADGLLS